jgi:hypothetical protein
MTLTKDCDLEEVKHQLCQEALALIKTGAEWKEVATDWGFSYQCGKFSVSDCHHFKSLLCKTWEGYEVINSSFFPMYIGPGFEDGFDKMMKEFKEAPATILLDHAREQIRKRQNQEKCEALTKVLGSAGDETVPRPRKTRTEQLPHYIYDRKPWWRFWQ